MIMRGRLRRLTRMRWMEWMDVGGRRERGRGVVKGGDGLGWTGAGRAKLDDTLSCSLLMFCFFVC